MRRQIRCTELTLSPLTAAIAGAVQWVTPSGGGSASVPRHHRLDHGLGQRRDARWPRLVVQQTVDALAHEPLLPAPHARFRHARPAHHLGGAAALPRRQNDPRPPDVLLGAVAVRHDRLEPCTITSGDFDLDPLAHGDSLPPARRQGNLLLEFIH